MSYYAASCGSAIGMMVSTYIYANAWRWDLLPKDFDFIHEFGRGIAKIDNRKVTMVVRMIVGAIAHPMIFVFIWGRDGLLGIDPLNSSVMSALLLLTLESALFSIGLWRGIPVKVPDEYLKKVIVLQLILHVHLGFWMGLTYGHLTIPSLW